jgi:CheY-like chemotaxis protein
MPSRHASMLKDEESPAPAAGGFHRLRVLVVDDHRDAAESLALCVETLGHEAFVAHDGFEALETALSTRPDVVLLDISLPGMSGDEVARALRASPQLRHATLVAVSGWGIAEDRASAPRVEFDRRCMKPIDLAMLEEVLIAAARRTH